MADIKELKHVSVATTYDLSNDFDSDKFIKMRLRVCHDGVNPNGSHFELDDMKKAENSIKNIPILANVIFDDDGQPQFGGHDMEIEKDKTDENNYRTIYKEVAIGIIPESNNYSIEEYDGKNYVFVDGYVWRGYSNYAEDIIERDKNIKLSMEINVDGFNFNAKERVYNITDYRYTGITFLGNDLGTGMKNAMATTETFSAEDSCTEQMLMIMQELKDTLAKFNKVNSEEGGNETMESTDTVVMSAETEAVEPQVESTETAEPEVTADTYEATESETTDEAPVSENNDEVADTEVEANFVKSFELSHDDVRCGLYALINECDFITEVFDEYFVYVDCSEHKYYKQSYSKDGDNLSLNGEPVEVFIMAVTSEEKNAIENMKSAYSEMETELGELRTYKANVEKEIVDAQKSEMIEKWSEVLKNNEQFEALKNDVETFSVEELETKCKCIFADSKAVFTFSAKAPSKESLVKIPMNDSAEDTSDEPYGGLFTEYGTN